MMPQYPGGGDLWEEPVPDEPSFLSRVTRVPAIIGVAFLIAALVLVVYIAVGVL